MIRSAIVVLSFFSAGQLARTDDALTLGELRTHATMHSIGIEWDVTGDANHNATCTVAYRAIGTQAWQAALPLLRNDYRRNFAGKRGPQINTLAGSILFLQPNTQYEVRLEAKDGVGGGDAKIVRLTTRAVPAIAADAPRRHVVPATVGETGGDNGDGSATRPFRGVAAAQQSARPGDVFLLHAGHYGHFVFDRSGESGRHIVWQSAADGDAVFEQIRVGANHVWFEGLKLRPRTEILALRGTQGASDVVVLRNDFAGFHNAIVLHAQSSGWYVADNVIVGDNDPFLKPPAAFDGEGIELSDSSGHTVCHNRISHTADGVSYPGANVDVFGNDIFDVCDDALEGDHGRVNVRFWGNRLTNYQFSGISFQPMEAGPWYLVRNQFIGRGEPFKLYGQDRFVCVNNTFVYWGSQTKLQSLLKTFSRNNLYVALGGGSPMFVAKPVPTDGDFDADEFRATWRTDVDYDGFATDAPPPLVRWNEQPFADLKAFTAAVGIEQHGLQLRAAELFDKFTPPPSRGPVAVDHLTLRPGTAAIDAGSSVPNLCEKFSGKSPDLGALELAEPLPHYGPRPKE